MFFWILAAALLAIAAFITCLPLFRSKTGWKPVALALFFALPAGALVLYQDVGTPEAIGMVSKPAVHAASEAMASNEEIDDLVGKLRARLDNTPASLDGWVLLARTLKTMQRYPEALEALETAQSIAPDDPFVKVELVEARIFMSPEGRINEEMVASLKEALAQEPGQQKGLWLMGIASAQAGDDEAAISYWETLLKDVESGSPVTQSVQQQIAAARERLGMPLEMAATEPVAQPSVEQAEAKQVTEIAMTEAVAEPNAANAAWPGLELRVEASAALNSAIPGGAVLWVMIRGPGPAVGPPIGVRRIIDPVLPLDLTISDQDSMLKERLISSEAELNLQVRLSVSGSPAARSGDWQSETLTFSVDSTKAVELIIDQQVE